MVIESMIVLVIAVENDDNDLMDGEGDNDNDTADEIFNDGSGISRDSDGDDDYEKG